MAYNGKRIKNIGDKVSYKFPKLKFILKPIYHILFYNRYGRKRRESYLKNAHETICKFNECMRENNIEYSLAYGTMLGAIRERGFIKHDADLDVFVWADDIKKNIKTCLEKYGFYLTRSMKVEDGRLGLEESYDYKSVSIDIFYIFKDNTNKNYICWFRPKDGFPTMPISMSETGGVKALIDYLPFVKTYKLVPFEDMMLPVFDNAEEMLLASYGKDYMIPDPSFKPKEIEFKGVKATYSGIGN